MEATKTMQQKKTPSYSTLNLILGSITIIFLAFFAAALVISAHKDILDTREEYYIVSFYHNIGLLEAGAPIKYGGVNIGKVTEIELQPDMRIRIECRLTMSRKIPTDSKLAVAATTVSGDTYLNLIIGTAPTVLAHSDRPENAPVLKGLNFIDIESLGSIFTDMQGIFSVFTGSLKRIFGKDSYTLTQYREAMATINILQKNFTLFNTEKERFLQEVARLTTGISNTKTALDTTLNTILKNYPMDRIKRNFQSISGNLSALQATMKQLGGGNDFKTIQNNITAVNSWVDTLKIEDRSILGIMLSKDCGGISKTIAMVGKSVKTAQDFSLFKKLGFYFDGKKLLKNFEERTHAEYLPASVYMYRWSVFSHQRYLHNCDLPCGAKSCPKELR